MSGRKTISLRVPEDAEVVVIEVRLRGGDRRAIRSVPKPQDEAEAYVSPLLPLYVMNARPDEWPQHPEWTRAGAVGVHLRVLQTQAEPEAIREHLDVAERHGVKVGLVIGVHNSRDWGAGTVFTQHTRRLPDGEVIPDYWSDAFMNEWFDVRRKVAEVVKDHPALAWVGHDFGLDDEAWPAKPWPRARAMLGDGMIWDYMMRYVRAAHELARMFAPVPVLAQCYTMYSRQGLDVLYGDDAPENLGIKLNGLQTKPLAPDEKVRPYWERVGKRGGMRMLEPGMVPTGDVDEDSLTARVLLQRSAQEWQADALNMQRQFVRAMVAGR